jgi:hypothetical protein
MYTVRNSVHYEIPGRALVPGIVIVTIKNNSENHCIKVAIVR